MKLSRVGAGHYRTKDGRAEIKKAVSQQTGYKDEICWVLVIDGKEQSYAYETLKDAKYALSKKLEQQ